MLGKVASGPLARSLLRPTEASTLTKRTLTFGPRQMQQMKNWIPSAMIYGTAAGVALVYFTDWHVITDWIPFYNGKYKKD